jgi:hypothetical protein
MKKAIDGSPLETLQKFTFFGAPPTARVTWC